MTKILDEHHGKMFSVYHGDNVEVIRGIPDDSVHLAITSPPFPGFYVYNNTQRDIGNARDIAHMLEHFRYLAGGVRRVLMPGRMFCVHLCQLTSMKSRDGYIGLKDYRGKMIECLESSGWVYAGEVTIDKNPQVQATRNKERGLLFKSLATDSSMMRMALADYVIYFRKPGDNPAPIRAGVSAKYNRGGGWITEDEWIEWAAPVWYRQTAGFKGGIRETDVLNVAAARVGEDERHLCPLQLGVIERCVKLWSAPGETVMDPFSGIGSTGVRSVELGRRYIGMELKESYYRTSIEYLSIAEARDRQRSMFDMLAETEPEPAEA